MLFPFPTFFFPFGAPVFDIWPWCTFFFISSSPTFFLPSLFRSASWNKGRASLPRGDGKTGQGNRSQVCAHTRVCVPPISHGGLNLGEGGEDVLSEKHWIGLMPGSVVTFTLRERPKRGIIFPTLLLHLQSCLTDAFPQVGLGCLLENPASCFVLAFVLTDPFIRSRLFLVCFKSIFNYYLGISCTVSPHLLLLTLD